MNSIRVPSPKKSVFDLTHDVKLSCNMGWLVPSMVMDLVPGDRVDLSTEALIRLAPLVSPMYARLKVTFHSWAIPYRILWPGWSDYITETKSGTPPVLPAFPTLEIGPTGHAYSELLDYLGIPDIPTGLVALQNEKISAMRLAAYQCVYNEFYRDENLVPEVNWELVDGDNNSNADLWDLRKRAWPHDYFTSNLPFAQKGDPVDLPISFTDLPVKANKDYFQFSIPGTDTQVADPTGWVGQPSGTATAPAVDVEDPNGTDVANTDAFFAQGAGTGSTTINDLRLAEQLQKYLERAARAGTRLVEWIRGMFDEILPDYTAQRPQYIGGTMSPIQISEVLNTTGVAGELPQGNMSGRGISVNSGHMGSYKAREHCVILTFMSIMPETTYQQGIEREWKKINDPKDFLNPLFAHLGEQETKNHEIMAYLATYSDNTFGYLPRYAEYRTIPNRVAGDFRTTLNYWTMSRIFDGVAPPQLNQTFIEADPTHRVFADTDPNDQKCYVHCLNKIRAVRPLPKYGTPFL